MREECLHMFSLVENWNDSQIDLLLEALRRDRSSSITDLAGYIGSKSSADVRALASALMSCTEEEVIGLGPAEQLTPARPESAIDIMIQVTKHICPNEFAYSKTIGEILDQLASWLEHEEKKGTESEIVTDSFGLRYSEVYYFLSALLLNRPLPALSEPASSAVLDLLTCIVRLVKIFDNECPLSQSKSNDKQQEDQKWKELKAVYHSACEKVIQPVGIYLACAAAVQWSAMCNPRSVPWSEAVLSKHPVAPFFVLGNVKRPGSLKVARRLRSKLLQKFTQFWNLPKLATDVGCTSKMPCSPEDPTFKQIVRQLNTFILNPFSLPLSVIDPSQVLVNELCQATTPSWAVDLQQLFSVLTPAIRPHLSSLDLPIQLPLTSADESQSSAALPAAKKRRTYARTTASRHIKRVNSEGISQPDAISPTRTNPVRLGRKRSTMEPATETEKPCSSASVNAVFQSNRTPPAISSSNTWKPSHYFRRILNEREAKVTDKTFRKYILVRDKFVHKPDT
ncbi:hypothetical protein EG68_07796 [Paragonimus skrjabini miyazakii]|uniref:Uncharacterized protein n=1 Tax=Paragonimus skrjabini miyazakii TaxID=59628 RepID=A0A8S9YL17_9TREM|nr:hypothetical protein EG68_07796 [Paragonimus skrjabini miyazakii]